MGGRERDALSRKRVCIPTDCTGNTGTEGHVWTGGREGTGGRVGTEGRVRADGGVGTGGCVKQHHRDALSKTQGVEVAPGKTSFFNT